GVRRKVVQVSDLATYLGPARYSEIMAEAKDEIGAVTGLAWTEVGGEILQIEATKMIGRGGLTLTGNLGEVMQESAKAAFSYVRSISRDLGIEGDITKDVDIHVHVPGGAIPKDGPSAGLAIATALVSMFTG